MNRKLSDGNIFRTTKNSLGLAGLALLALLCAEPTRAQSKPAQTETVAARSAAAAPETSQAPEQNSSANSSTPKGDFEGIKVHGHWVIEIKNPDGKVVTRREFENAIQPSGMSYLAALLAGNNSPGGLEILLNGAHSTFQPSPGYTGTTIIFTDPGPCLPLVWIIPTTGALYGITGGPSTGTTCLIANPTTYLGYTCYRAQAANASLNSPSPCSTLLTTTAPTYTPQNDGASGVQVVLSGSVLVSSSIPGSVTDVETVFTTCDTNTSPTQCLNYFNPITPQALGNALPAQITIFTMRLLDGNNGDPAAVPYTPGQSISVTVTISFQ